jgi:hypothetical protein
LARELDSTFFPTDLGEAQTVLAAGPLARPRRNLVNQAIIYCVDSVLKTGNKPADRDRYITALVAMSALYHDVALDALKKKMDATFSSVDPERFRFALGIVALVEGVWDSLSASSKSKCRSFVKADADVIAQRYLPSLCDVDEIRRVFEERIRRMEIDDLTKVVKSGAGQMCVERAKDLFCHAGSWHSANAIANGAILPLANEFSHEQIEEILRSPEEQGSDLPGSGGISQFVEALRERDDIEHAWLDGLLKANGFSYLCNEEEVPQQE